MKACVLHKSGSLEKSAFEVTTQPKPTPADHEVLVKVEATALNPVDWKMALRGFLIQKYPVTLGCDVGGVVEEVGKNVTNFKKGDRIGGFTELGKPGAGTFAEYCVIDASIGIHLPDNVSFEEGSTLGVGGLTAALGLHRLGLPLPPNKVASKENILVWGGASSVGMFIIQFANLIGLHVIATASAKNFDLLKKLGASEVFDYNSPNVVDELKAATGGKLKYAFDTIGSNTADLCVSILNENGSIAVIAGKPTKAPSTVTVADVFLGGDTVKFHDFLVGFAKEFSTLISGPVKTNPVHKYPGGLEAVPDALVALQQGKVSAQKIVLTWK